MKKSCAIAAVGLLALGTAAHAGDDLKMGKQVYNKACLACHATGAANAPKLGDKGAWADRITKGKDTLVQNAINGFQGSKGVMPPKGGRTDLSNDEVAAAVAYMIDQSK